METVAPFQEIVDEIVKAGGSKFAFCYQCGKCDVVCPWNRVSQFSIRKIIRQAALGLPDIEADDIWKCTTCGTCPAICPRGVEQIEVGVAIRRLATSYDAFPESVRPIRGVAASLRSDGNPLSLDRGARADWAKGLGVPAFHEDMEILYFVGCYNSYDPRMKKAAVATARLLKAAGVNFGILGEDESCAGESIRKTGDEELFKSLARKNIGTFIARGVKRILVTSPHAYEAFKRDYQEFMVHFDVVHIAPYLKELIEAGRLQVKGEYRKRVTFHDPCYLGRHNGIYEEPRDLLKALTGLELVEMADHHAKSLCCGGGGGRIWMETPKNERFANLRVAQAEAVGAEVLVSACPYCISNFEESRLSLQGDEPLEVKDLSEVLADAILGELP